MKKEGMKLVANNKKAYHDYFIEETYEAGLALVGTEVKSLRLGKCSIKEAWVRVESGECFVYGMHISPYESSFCISGRSRALRAPPRKRAIRSCRWRSISRTAGRS